MHTSLLVLALTGPFAAPAPQAPETPNWQDSYRAARDLSWEHARPLAVFLSSGPAGWETLTNDGKPNRQSRQLLARHFVCLYVDRSTPEGRQLAEAFEISSDTGLVISTRDGDGQAFSYQGTMSRSELEETLRTYSNGKVVRRTETLDRARLSSNVYPDSSMRPLVVRQATIPTTPQPINFAPPPVFAPPPMFAPPMSFGGGFSSGGC